MTVSTPAVRMRWHQNRMSLANCTPRLAARLLACACALALALAWGATSARADGDPASDVLAAGSVFVPADGGVSAGAQARLTAAVDAATRSGYPIRVALIATPADLGSVSQLWRRPRSYAAFLGPELSLVYRGVLLVVMPNGLGFFHVGAGTPPPVPDSLVSLRPGRALADAAVTAVTQLAAIDGHPLSVSAQAGAGSSAAGGGSWLASVDAGSWLALAAGLALIAAAWAVSLRARPPGRDAARPSG